MPNNMQLLESISQLSVNPNLVGVTIRSYVSILFYPCNMALILAKWLRKMEFTFPSSWISGTISPAPVCMVKLQD